MSMYSNRGSGAAGDPVATDDNATAAPAGGVTRLTYEDTLEAESDETLRHEAVLAANDDADDADDVTMARAQIEETRAHLSDTVEAIKDKLSPQHLVEEAKESVKAAATNKLDQVKEAAMGVAHSVADTVSDVAHSVTDKAKDVAHSVTDKAKDVAHSVTGTAKTAASSTSEVARPVVTHAQRQGEALVDVIRMNPLPAAIAGFGLGWLLLSIRRQKTYRYNSIGIDNDYNGVNSFDRGRSVDTLSNRGMATPTGFGYQPLDSEAGTASLTVSTVSEVGNGSSVVDRAKEGLQSATGAVSSVAGATKEKVADVAGTALDVAGSAKDKVVDVAGAAKEKVVDVAGAAKEKVSNFAVSTLDAAGDIASTAKDKASDLAYAAKDKAQATYSWLDSFVHENPLAAGAAALLIGAAVGLALPSTRKENEWMGDTRDRLKDKASDLASEYVERAQHAAEVTINTAKETLSQTKDNISDSLGQAKDDIKESFSQAKDDIKDTMTQAKDEVKDEVKNQAQDVVKGSGNSGSSSGGSNRGKRSS